MSQVEAQSEPSDVIAEAGNVIIEGPDGVAVTLTPEAADETGRRLLHAAHQARCQRQTAPRGRSSG